MGNISRSIEEMLHQKQTFFKKGVLKNFAIFTGKHLRWSFLFNKVAGLGFSCEYCEILRTSFFYRTSPVAASGVRKYRRFFISNTFISNARLKLAKNLAKAT